jgi:hypothetical protein
LIQQIGKALRKLKLLALATVVGKKVFQRCELGIMQQ